MNISIGTLHRTSGRGTVRVLFDALHTKVAAVAIKTQRTREFIWQTRGWTYCWAAFSHGRIRHGNADALGLTGGPTQHDAPSGAEHVVKRAGEWAGEGTVPNLVHAVSSLVTAVLSRRQTTSGLICLKMFLSVFLLRKVHNRCKRRACHVSV